VNFALSAEQELLRDTVRNLLADSASLSIAQVRALSRSHSEAVPQAPFGAATAAHLDDTELWRQLGELGFLGLPFAAEHSGSEGTFMDLAVVLEEMGRAVGPPSYTATVVLCGVALRHHGSPALQGVWIPEIAAGRARLALAIAEDEGLEEPDAVRMTARPEGDDLVLDGVKRHVEEAGRANAFLVAARGPRGGASLLLVDADASGITLRPQRTVAGGDRADVDFQGVRVPRSRLVGDLDGAENALTELLQRGAVAACLDMVGAGQAVLEMATDYAAERVQFGKRIGSFQAIQHHAANMAVDVDASRLITYQAAWRLSEGLDAALEASMAKAWTGEAYRRVVTLGHQLFGGIGLMREHDMHLYLRRSRLDDLAFGDAPVHLDRIADILEERPTPWPHLRGHSVPMDAAR
jgi:alkylation response protein AidB-like acyl-CoA dehydrogenase